MTPRGAIVTPVSDRIGTRLSPDLALRVRKIGARNRLEYALRSIAVDLLGPYESDELPALVAELRKLARQLADAGLPLDPDDHGVLLVLAQLALLEVDLEHLDAGLVDDLNVLPPGSFRREDIDRGWTELTASRHATARIRADLGSIAEQLAATRSGLGHIPAPYAQGARRASPPGTQRLRNALTGLLAGDRSLTPRVLLDPFDGEEHPALARPWVGPRTSCLGTARWSATGPLRVTERVDASADVTGVARLLRA